MRLAVLASNRGTILEALIKAVKDNIFGELLDIALVISDNPDARALSLANDNGIVAKYLDIKSYSSNKDCDMALCQLLQSYSVDLVLLAGYLKKIGSYTISAFNNRIINTHPSLLPNYGGKGMYGRHVYQAVLADNNHKTGITIHFLDNDYDTGTIIAQREVMIKAGDDADSLAARVQQTERLFVIDTILAIAKGELKLPES